jgi:hypothetical protein
MPDSVIHGAAIVLAYVYIAIGGSLLASTAIIWLSSKLESDR